MRKIIAAAAANLFSFLNLQAQTLNDEEVRAQLLKDWERAKAYTIDYLNTVPADKYSFRATDSIRNFAQQMLHLAQSNVNIIAFAAGEPNFISNPQLETSKTAQSKDSVMYYVIASYDLVIDGIKKINTATFNEKVKFYDWEETKYVWLLKAFEHQTHHRAQTTIYIRLMGLHPPQERLF
jgi:uncharacterized damage-inducible protein DinB